MTWTGIGMLCCVVVMCVCAFRAGYSCGVDKGHNQVISFLEDEAPEAYAVLVRDLDRIEKNLQARMDGRHRA